MEQPKNRRRSARTSPPSREETHRRLQEVAAVLCRIETVEQMTALLEEMLTPKEIETLALRWQLLKDLHAGITQRSIAARHGISLCKITRGSKVLKKKGSVVKQILDRVQTEHG